MKERTDQMRSLRSKAMLRGVIGGFTAPLMIFPVVTQMPAEGRPRTNIEESFRSAGSAIKQAMKKHRSNEPV